MNELIKVTTNENGEQLVNGRELYEFLGVKDNYTDWFKRMIKYGFDENVDFISFSEKSDKPFGGRPQVNHYVKLDMAKEISMLQRTERGKQARRYFIQLEKFWNSPEMVTKRALEFQQKKIEVLQLENESLKPKALFADAVDASKTSILIGDLAKLIKQNGIDIGQNRLFQWLRDNGYLIARKGESYNWELRKSRNEPITIQMEVFELVERRKLLVKGKYILLTSSYMTRQHRKEMSTCKSH